MLAIRTYVSLFLLLVNCTSQPEEVPLTTATNDEQAITQVSAARAEAFNQSDAAGIAKYFTSDALLMAPGKSVMVGRDSVQAYYQAIFDQYQPVLKSHYEEVSIEGDLAYGRGEATVTLTPNEGGKPTTSTSKYLNILRRQPNVAGRPPTIFGIAMLQKLSNALTFSRILGDFPQATASEQVVNHPFLLPWSPPVPNVF
ncbi:YybH family protein [Tunicatimonas pelagia]|uniref:YybH family protein n=1 Tax=Tunicatimonas pelagia TaxID=931531 RepID=UPI002665BDCE|nr:SgcJ/EcaC family oxidoreductase [Tunicatimonas pelagia]WKN41054.1 SgcJ/EcaC family oxidoreductase [Tunicatimonas pelagia]